MVVLEVYTNGGVEASDKRKKVSCCIQLVYGLMCPLPSMKNFVVVSCWALIGPLACSFWVLIPISAPRPNWLPSVKRVEAFQ